MCSRRAEAISSGRISEGAMWRLSSRRQKTVRSPVAASTTMYADCEAQFLRMRTPDASTPASIKLCN
jgi:hypothetical protein